MDVYCMYCSRFEYRLHKWVCSKDFGRDIMGFQKVEYLPPNIVKNGNGKWKCEPKVNIIGKVRQLLNLPLGENSE